jgi:hypothetical protein
MGETFRDALYSTGTPLAWHRTVCIAWRFQLCSLACGELGNGSSAGWGQSTIGAGFEGGIIPRLVARRASFLGEKWG